MTRVRWQLAPTGAARGRTEREAIIVRIGDGFGEAAPLTDDSQARDAAMQFALETARLDDEARARGVSLAELLVAQPSASLPYARVVDDPRDASGACIKIKVGPTGDVERVRAIAAAAPNARLRVDANRSWPADRVVELMRAYAGLPIDYIEEPCADAAALATREPLPLPIALDESLAAIAEHELDVALRSGRIAALVLKPTLLGGFARCLELAARARAAGVVAIVSHALEGPIGTAACAELARAIGGIAPVGLAPHPALDAWRIAVPQLGDGVVQRAPHPGLGLPVTLLEPAIARLAVEADSSPARARAVDVRSGVRCILATPERATIDAITQALDAREPLALLHHKLPPAELARQRAVVAASDIPDDTAFVQFTSGSTGDARGVVLSRAAVDAAVAASAAHLGWRDDDRWLLALSMAHAGGLAIVARCHAAGRPIVLADDAAPVAGVLAECTLASLVPTQLAALLDDPAWRPPPRLRAVLLGGAAASPVLLARAAERSVPFLTTYGMTETFGQIATAPLDRAGDPAAPLVPLAGVELRTDGSPGRIHVRTPMLATRYLDGAPIAPELATSDLGYVERGAIVIVGRADDTIITGGENVHPASVEAVLAATPGVRAVCVFGIADARWGQLVAAAIAADATFDTSAAAAHWHAHLAPHARPRELAIADALPLLPNGKLDRRAAARLPRRPIAYP